MNLTDIDVTKATPIDFDDIREGDTIARTYNGDVAVTIVRGKPNAHWLDGSAQQYRDALGAEWFLLDRPSPPSPEPGTTGTATVAGRPDQWVARIRTSGGPLWTDIEGGLHGQVTDFVADPAPGIPQPIRDAALVVERSEAFADAPDSNFKTLVEALLAVVGSYSEARDV